MRMYIESQSKIKTTTTPHTNNKKGEEKYEKGAGNG